MRDSALSTIHPAEPRIVLLRLSAIGDVVHGLPVLMALRKARPGAFICWVVESRSANLLQGHRALDEVIVLPRGWYKSLRRLLALRRRLKELEIDTAIDLQGLTKSAGIGGISGIRRRIGFAAPDGRELSRWINTEHVRAISTHVIDRNLELLEPLGITRPEVHFGLDDLPQDARFADEVLRSAHMARPMAIINPGGGWTSKLWPAERFAAVARHIGSRFACRSLVVWNGDKERNWAASIVGQSQGHAALAPATSLRQLAALARRASLFIASDTGPLHIAAAVGTRCVGLYGPMPAERNGPYGPQHIRLQRMLLEGTSRQRRRAGPESMEAISVEDVTAACETILSRASAMAM